MQSVPVRWPWSFGPPVKLTFSDRPSLSGLVIRVTSKRTPEGLPVQRLRTLLEHLGTLTMNRVTLTRDDPHEFELLARKTPLQAAALALLAVDPTRVVSSKLTVGMTVIVSN